MAVEEPEAPFVISRKVYRLVWPEGSDYAGLVVRAQSLPMGMFLELAPMVDRLATIQPTDLRADSIDTVLEPFRVLGKHLVSWNLMEEVDGDVRPVPATFEGLISQEPDLIREVISAWMRATGTVPGPLGTPSSPGEDELMGSMPMQTLPPM